jgi:endonuclease III
MTDRREESVRVYESHGHLADHHPEIYTREVLDLPPGELEEILMKYKVGSPRQSADYWPRSARTLFEEYGCEPLRIYEGRTIDEIVQTKSRSKKLGGDPLPGFGPKILSLLAIYLTELGSLNPIPDAFPVDVHVQRFCISTGILEGEGKVTNEEAERVLRPGLCALCKEMGWHALELSHAIWFLGNRLCTGCSRNRAVKVQCSAYEKCGGAIVSGTYFKKGYWLLDETRLRKGGTMVLQNFEDMPLFASCAG